MDTSLDNTLLICMHDSVTSVRKERCSVTPVQCLNYIVTNITLTPNTAISNVINTTQYNTMSIMSFSIGFMGHSPPQAMGGRGGEGLREYK